MKISIITFVICAVASSCWGWDNNTTHPQLTKYVAEHFFDPDFYTQNIQLGQVTNSAEGWLMQGAIHEDDGSLYQFINGTARSINHFHDPTITNSTKNTLETSGLSDLTNGVSAILWAQTGAYQTSLGWQDWSWANVRNYEYAYLTANSTNNQNANLANMLYGLGCQMHLIQDMSQPAHTRNNTHIMDGMSLPSFIGSIAGNIETWAANTEYNNGQTNVVTYILNNQDAKGNYLYPVPNVTVDLTQQFDMSHPALVPVSRLFDTRAYLGQNTPTMSLNQGLAEYTNGNYFSQDTIFAAERFSNNTSYKYYFPYPRQDGTTMQYYLNRQIAPSQSTEENGTVDTTIWITKNGDGVNTEQVNHLTREGNTTRAWQIAAQLTGLQYAWEKFYGSFELDEQCYLDYAEKLLPRAVGYSYSMLNYFFRGSLNVTIPTNTPPNINKITLNVQNNTPTGETMDAGSVEMMAIFRTYSSNGTATSGILAPGGNLQYRHYVVAGNACTNSDPCSISTSGTSFAFVPDPANASPIPPLACDISLVVIYKGTLGVAGQGVEQNAVAYNEIYLNGIGGSLGLSLPTQGVYAAVSKSSGANTFNNFAIAAQNNTMAPLGQGSSQVMIIYRTGDPLQMQPDDYMNGAINYVSATIPDPDQYGFYAKTDMTFPLTSGIPVAATDVYAYVIHTDNYGIVTYGYLDISEPTPVDVFNDADNICINSQWYVAGGPNAIALANPNNDGNYLFDPYAYNINNIYFKAVSATVSSPASASNFTLQSTSTLPGGGYMRLGYILTDYNFNYSFDENWVSAGQADPFEKVEPAEIYPGTAVINQTDGNGNYSDPSMYNMRGYSMWWGAGIIYDNSAYPSNSVCSWSAIPQ